MKVDPKNGVIEFTFNSSTEVRAILDRVYLEIKSGKHKLKSSVNGCNFNFRVSDQDPVDEELEFTTKIIKGKRHYILPSKRK